MAQSAVTVRMDSEMKTQFDALCEQFGMSANTAFNIFVKAVIRSRSIPFAIKGSPSAQDLFMQQRRAAELSKESELSLDEINAEIRAAREEMRKRKSVKAWFTQLLTPMCWYQLLSLTIRCRQRQVHNGTDPIVHCVKGDFYPKQEESIPIPIAAEE